MCILIQVKASFELCDPWPIINKPHILTVPKQKYIHYSLYVFICLAFHIHHRVNNVFIHILFDMYDIQIKTEEISFLVRKLLKNTSFNPIIGHTKIIKFLLTELKTKYNTPVPWDHIIQFFTWRYRHCNIHFNTTYKEIIFVLFVLVIGW